MQVDGRGLDVVMPQVILNMGDGVSPIEHIHSPGVTKAVDRVNRFETFRRKGHGEIFFTNAINAMACQLFTALIDKKAMVIHLLWRDTIFFYIEL